jgi:hypothetical protein
MPRIHDREVTQAEYNHWRDRTLRQQGRIAASDARRQQREDHYRQWLQRLARILPPVEIEEDNMPQPPRRRSAQLTTPRNDWAREWDQRVTAASIETTRIDSDAFLGQQFRTQVPSTLYMDFVINSQKVKLSLNVRDHGETITIGIASERNTNRNILAQLFSLAGDRVSGTLQRILMRPRNRHGLRVVRRHSNGSCVIKEVNDAGTR